MKNELYQHATKNNSYSNNNKLNEKGTTSLTAQWPNGMKHCSCVDINLYCQLNKVEV